MADKAEDDKGEQKGSESFGQECPYRASIYTRMKCCVVDLTSKGRESFVAQPSARHAAGHLCCNITKQIAKVHLAQEPKPDRNGRVYMSATQLSRGRNSHQPTGTAKHEAREKKPQPS